MTDEEYKKEIEAKQAVYDKMCLYCERNFLEACNGVYNELFSCNKAKEEVKKITRAKNV